MTKTKKTEPDHSALYRRIDDTLQLIEKGRLPKIKREHLKCGASARDPALGSVHPWELQRIVTNLKNDVDAYIAIVENSA